MEQNLLGGPGVLRGGEGGVHRGSCWRGGCKRRRGGLGWMDFGDRDGDLIVDEQVLTLAESDRKKLWTLGFSGNRRGARGPGRFVHLMTGHRPPFVRISINHPPQYPPLPRRHPHR